MICKEDDQTVEATASEKTGEIAIDGKGCEVARKKNTAPAHFDLETSVERRGNGYDLEAAFSKGCLVTQQGFPVRIQRQNCVDVEQERKVGETVRRDSAGRFPTALGGTSGALRTTR
jgi:hypothetical protein